MDAADEVFTVSETARELKKAAQTIRDWSDSGKIRAKRTVGGTRIFTRAEIERVRKTLRSKHGDEAA
jgi:DNA-binding transcriptional MerR regulator